MAYREVAMWEILAVLEGIGRGESQAVVGRVSGHTRKTIRRYVRTAKSLGWGPGTDPPTEALAAEVFLRHRPSRDRSPGEVEAELLPHLEAIRSWLTPAPGEKRGLKLTRVKQLLERQGTQIPYSSLHRFAVNQCGFGKSQRSRFGWRSVNRGSWPRWISEGWVWFPTLRQAAVGWPGPCWLSLPTAATSTSTSPSPRSLPTSSTGWRTPGSDLAGCLAGSPSTT